MTNSAKIILALFLMLLIVSKTTQSQYQMVTGFSNDTMLFDGENSNYSPVKKCDDCGFKVTFFRGSVIGTTTRRELVAHMCGPGEYEDVVGQYQLDIDDQVMTDGATIKTGPFSNVQLETSDGTTVRIGPNSEVMVDCSGNTSTFKPDNEKISVKLVLGTIWSKVKHALGNEKAMQVESSGATAGVRGTIFSFESKKENGKYVDILRTFEGSVEFMGNAENKLDKEEIQRQEKILEEDFRSGKISLEEFTKKIKELTDPVVSTVDQFRVMVDAGNESFIRGTEPPTTPAKYTETGDEWYLDKNFTK